jgi:MFS family permease
LRDTIWHHEPWRGKRLSTIGSEVTARKHLALFLLCLASFIAVVDTTIVSSALPSMRRELGFPGADAGWILNGYALTFGGLVLLLGRAGDLYGRRRLFVAGLALEVKSRAPNPMRMLPAA